MKLQYQHGKTIVKNLNDLSANTDDSLCQKARLLALRAYQKALNAVAPSRLLKQHLKLHDGHLLAKDLKINLKHLNQIIVIGAGKAGLEMAQATYSILGDKISTGIINCPSQSQQVGPIRINPAGHPSPDEAGLCGAKQMIGLAAEARHNDLIIALISGGGSSMLPLPREGVALDDKIELTQNLLRSGADILEINSVRKHLSAIKGGQLARAAMPATLISLILSDVIGDPLDTIASGPTVSDPTTFAMAIEVLKRHNLWQSAPEAAKNLLETGMAGQISETPKPGFHCFDNSFNQVIGNNRTAITAAADYLRQQGIENIRIMPENTGSADDTAQKLAATLAESAAIMRPCAVVGGGETLVKVTGPGKGGRNQEMALWALCSELNCKNAAFLFAGTDGIDGPTDAAGAIIDSQSRKRAAKLELEPRAFLCDNDSYSFFARLNDLVTTGYTGTNVNDLYIGVAL